MSARDKSKAAYWREYRRMHREQYIAGASPRPWRVEYVTRGKTAFVKAADDAVVCVCHADNAEIIVKAANEMEVGK